MALVASLASWDEPSVSSFAAWTARELNEAGQQLKDVLKLSRLIVRLQRCCGAS